MGKPKRRLTAAEKAERKRRREKYMTVFIRGKQKRIRRPPTIDGMDVDEFILRNADPIWLHQNEMWEYLEVPEERTGLDRKIVLQDSTSREGRLDCEKDDEIPF